MNQKEQKGEALYYYSKIHDWFQKDSLIILEEMIKTLEALAKKKFMLNQKAELMKDVDIYNTSKKVILNLVKNKDDSFDNIKEVCNEILSGQLIWCRNIQLENNKSIGEYADSIIEILK